MWKASTLSFGGKLTLTKYVLGSLPTYFLSFLKAREEIIDSLEKKLDDDSFGPKMIKM